MMRRLLNRVFGDLETFAFYWRVAIKPNPKEAAALLSLIVSSSVLDALSVGLTVPLLDVLTHDEAHRSQMVAVVERGLAAMGFTPSPNVTIFVLMGIASLVFLIRNALTLFSTYWTSTIAATLRAAMRVSLFHRLLHARYEEIAKRARGTLVHDINGPPEALAAVIVNLGVLCTALFNILLMIGLLLYLSWWATILLGLLAFGGIQAWRWYADRRASAQGKILYTLRGEQSKLQVDAIDGMRVVKAHGLENQMVARLRGLLNGDFRSEMKLVFYRNAPVLMNELTAITIVLTLGGLTFLVPSVGLRFSTLTAFLLAMRRIAPAAANVNASLVLLNQHQQNLRRIEEVMHQIPQEKHGGIALRQIDVIELNRLGFAYQVRPDYRVLEGVSASMARGTVTALVGPTGSGKSTVAGLLMGLYDPQEGSILVNGVNLRELDLRAWRRQVGYVSQDIFVFNATIEDNMVLGDETISAARMEWAARVAQLHDFIVSLPDGYHTVVGDRGLRLSGGQCQRLAIARAIVHQPQVLIFDEATSALDNLTERAVYDAIGSLQREAIILVIAHRLSTIRDADQILVMQGGRVVERGAHEQLLSRRGTYAALYEEDRSSLVREVAKVEEA